MNTQKPDAVEPCPFCKGEMVPSHDYRDSYENCPDDADAIAYYYRCRSCAATSGWSKSESGAVRYANMRTLELTAERDALKAEVAAGKQWRERCEELEVVAAALYLGHDDGRMQFDIYRSLYIATADDDIMWERAALEGESR